MENQTLPLSVIIPIYNVEPYLSRCLESVLNQTIPVQEIICVDDGSTDESGEILDQYALKYPQIKAIHKKNGGLVSARIAGLEKATCPYIAAVDSDDFVELDAFEYLMEIALREDADIVTSGYYRDYGYYQMTESEMISPGCYRGEPLLWLQSHLVLLDQFYRATVFLSLCSKVYKADFLRPFQNTLDTRINWGEDLAVIFPMLLHASCVCVASRPTYHYCLRNDSIVGGQNGVDAERINIFLRTLKKRLEVKKEKISNVMLQYQFIAHYFHFFTDVESVLSEQGNYFYPFGNVPKHSRILLYGSGRFGKALKNYLDRHDYRVVAWADRMQNRLGVIAREAILSLMYDIVLVGIIKANIADDVVEDLKRLGVPSEKIRRIDARLIREATERELAGENR